MATDKPRFSVTFTEESFRKIQQYQKNNHINTQSKAVAKLVEIAIQEIETVDSMKTFPRIPKTVSGENTMLLDEQTHIKKYRSLDPYGKEAVDSVLDVESRRCEAERAAKLLGAQNQPEPESSEETIYFITPWFSQLMSAGTGGEAGEEYPEDLRLIKAPPRGTSYVAPVRGDSMEPTYRDGNRLFVHAQEEIQPGQIGVFFMGSKQWVKELGDGVLLSRNPRYENLSLWGKISAVRAWYWGYAITVILSKKRTEEFYDVG